MDKIEPLIQEVHVRFILEYQIKDYLTRITNWELIEILSKSSMLDLIAAYLFDKHCSFVTYINFETKIVFGQG